MEVSFTRLPMSVPCPVPVTPETREAVRDGEPIAEDERTDLCAVDAYWMIGAQVTCDVHLRIACVQLELDYDALCAEAGGPMDMEDVPYLERRRYSQEDARRIDALSR